MKKVILYGIRGRGRKEVEKFLSDSYVIVGYSDSDIQYWNCQYINFTKFYRPEELKDVEFDYLVITPLNFEVSNEIKKNVCVWVDASRIVQYALFADVQYPHPYEIFQKISDSCEFAGFILGMSHAHRGIDVNLFNEPVFNFGFNSNDLFYYYHLLKKLLDDKEQCRIKYCILELPYYIFNWDRSLSRSAFRSMNSYEILGQFHHLDTMDGNLIKEYQAFENMFKRKKMYNVSVHNTGIYDVRDAVADQDFMGISHVWKSEHTNTWKENVIYFQQLITLLHQINKYMKIYVAIFPQNPRFYKKHYEIIDRVKKNFYETIESMHLQEIDIWDYFEVYEQMEEYFEDDCHLNTSGRKAFTKRIIYDLEKYE